MAQAQARVDGAKKKTGSEAGAFDDVLKLVHGGGRSGAVDGEEHDAKAKLEEAIETAPNGAVRDNPVVQSNAAAVVTGQAIPGGGVAEQAGAAEGANDTDALDEFSDAFKALFDPAFIFEYLNREDVKRDIAALAESIRAVDDGPEDWDEDQWRL